MKKIRLTIICILCLVSIAASAHDFEAENADGVTIYYTITSSVDKTVSVSYRGTTVIEYNSEYTGVVNIPDKVTYSSVVYSVTSIGYSAFSGCSGLTSVIIPNSVTSIDDAAFAGCSGLTSITIPNSVTSIGAQTFEGCSGLTAIIIPKSVTRIEGWAYKNCSGLTSITIPNSVTSIGDGTFENCIGLTSFEIPNSVMEIGAYVFSGCSNLSDITVNWNTPLVISSSIFYNINLSKITLHVPLGTKKLYQGAAVWNGFGIISDPAIIASSLTLSKRSVIIKNGETVKLTATILPENAYDKTVIWSSSKTAVATVSDDGLVTAVSAGTATIMAKTNDGSNLLASCEVTIQSLSPIITFADANVKSLCVTNWSKDYDGELSEEEAAAVKDLGKVFKGNGDIVSFDELQYFVGLESIGDMAFRGCSGLTSVIIPKSVQMIGEMAFGWTALESIILPDSISLLLRSAAFIGCTKLKSVYYPSNASAYGNVFYGCTNLTMPIYSKDQFVYLPQSFSGEYTIPSGIRSIVADAFENCKLLTSVTIPSSVQAIGNNAFNGCSGLLAVDIPDNVNSIGEYAFINCTSLTDVTVHWKTPPTIPITVFSDLSKLTLHVPAGTKALYQSADVWKDFGTIVETANPINNIIFADANVKAICVANWDTNGDGELSEEEAAAVKDLGSFRCNYSITSFDELKYFIGLTSIGKDTFWDATNLISVIIPNSVTNIESQAFGSCKHLKSIIIPNSVTSIGNYAFMDCSDLTTVTIGDSVTSIGSGAFSGCSGLTKVTLGNSVTSIGDWSFSCCSGLTSINMPNSVTIIGSQAFNHCSNLTSVIIPNSVTSIGEGAFGFCSGLTSIQVDSLNSIYDSRENCNAIISKKSNTLSAGCINTKIPNSVTSIGGNAFSGCLGLTSITIPNTVISIGSSAFSGCSGLTSIKIPNSIKSFGENAFYDCSGLTDVAVYWDKPLSVPIGLFAGVKTSGITLHVPSGTKALYEAADVWKDFGTIVEAANPINNIIFADANVKAICVANWDTNGDGELSEEEAAAVTDLGVAFSDNTDIKLFNELRYFTGLFNINNMEFRGCSGLASIIIPNTARIIGGYAFSGCIGLTTITIPNSVTQIGIYAFYSCKGLTSVTIPNSVTSIGNGAFMGCSNLSATMPNSVNSIGEYAFSGCLCLKSITIHNSVTSIGDFAFEKCKGLKSVTISNTVINIGYGAFSDCTNLTDVIVNWNTPLPVSESVFTNVNLSDATLYVPANTETVYLATDVWKDFGTIVETANPINNIIFADANVKAICVANWDTNGDGELSEEEAAAVTDLGEVFKGNSKITSFEELKYFTGLTCIGSSAFYDCSGLTDIIIPSSVTAIRVEAFFGCCKLRSIFIPNSITTVGLCAFSGCSSLTSIIVDSSNQIYDSRDNCNAIIEKTTNTLIVGCGATIIPNSVTAIQGHSFWGCSSLTNLIIPNSVKTIGMCAFSGCNNLKNLIIPNSVIGIGSQAFCNCTQLVSITIPSSVELFEGNVFVGCSGLSSIIVDSGNKYYDSRDNCNAIIEKTTNKLIVGCKNTIIPNSVTSIGNNAFQNCSSLTSITIPNSVQAIGNNAFNGCSGLLAVDIPDNVNSIGEYAFINCTSLTDVTVHWKTPPTIPITVFPDLSKLTLHVPAGTKALYQSADVWKDFGTIVETANPINNITFADANVKAICVANWDTNGDGELSEEEAAAVTDLGEVFKGNSKITSFEELKYFTGLTCIGSSAFYDCSGLTSITIPNSVTSIRVSAFKGCSGFTSITIPNSVTTIYDKAFAGCSGLTSIIIPNSVMGIGYQAFDGCSGMISVIVDSDNKYYDSRGNCNAIIEKSTNSMTVGCKNTIIPNSVTSIGSGAFGGCSGLTSITIPNSVTSIGNNAFVSCFALTSINIPNSVTSIGSYAFNACTGLTDVIVNWKTPLSIDNKVFDISSINKTTLHVPQGTKTLYETTDVWGYFGSIVEPTISVSAITLSNSSIALEVGKTATLAATIKPNNATDKSVTWSSSNNFVASVSAEGVVMAVSAGTATITAKTNDGSNLSASCEVTVSKYTQSIELVKKIPTLELGGEMYKIEASASAGLPLTFDSNNKDVVSVFDLGDAVYLNPVGCGKADIIIRQAGNDKYEPTELTTNVEVVASGYQSSKILIAYYSDSKTIDDIVMELAKQVGSYSGYVYTQKIEPTNTRINEAGGNRALCDSIFNCIKAAPNDLSSYPAIAEVGVDPFEYDAILMVYPLWYSKTAAPMQTFQFMYKSDMKDKSLGYIEFDEQGGSGSTKADVLCLTSETEDKAKSISDWLSGGISTDIEHNADGDGGRTVIYDMQGRRLQSINGKGLFIVNGRKVWR